MLSHRFFIHIGLRLRLLREDLENIGVSKIWADIEERLVRVFPPPKLVWYRSEFVHGIATVALYPIGLADQIPDA
jgi:hypothetical protein